MHHHCIVGHTLLSLYQVTLLQPFTHPCWTQGCNRIQSSGCTSWSSKYVCHTDCHHSFILAITSMGGSQLFWNATALISTQLRPSTTNSLSVASALIPAWDPTQKVTGPPPELPHSHLHPGAIKIHQRSNLHHWSNRIYHQIPCEMGVITWIVCTNLFYITHTQFPHALCTAHAPSDQVQKSQYPFFTYTIPGPPTNRSMPHKAVHH